MEAMECLKTRRSVRNFSGRGITENVIEEMIDAGRLAPTANNIQPWEFIVVSEESVRTKIAGITNYGKFIAESPVCIIVACKDTKYYLEDGSAATQSIMLAGWAHGVGSCWVAGDKKPYAEEILKMLGFPAGYRLVSLIACGYPQAPPGKKSKRGLKEVLHKECF